ncbi:MAG: glutathione peroxidase [Bacteroidales bacterium]|nr:glutathione peroxidase [Bacteroidales bacterium]
MRTILFTISLLIGGLALVYSQENVPGENKPGIYDFTVEDSQGKSVSMAEYKNKTLLIVNVASKCGYTKQYEPLEEMYKKYKSQGFLILGFPSNQFMNQEPGTNAEIQEFCRLNYGVTFPVLAKIEVNGDEAHPLYKYLKEQTGGTAIKWNFNKFLIDKKGNIVKRYLSGDSLKELEKDIKTNL